MSVWFWELKPAVHLRMFGKGKSARPEQKVVVGQLHPRRLERISALDKRPRIDRALEIEVGDVALDSWSLLAMTFRIGVSSISS